MVNMRATFARAARMRIVESPAAHLDVGGREAAKPMTRSAFRPPRQGQLAS
jgi:hypothetical protein